MNVDILGRRWKVSVLSSEAFNKRFKEDLAGITLPLSLEIVVNAEELTLATIRHETWHAVLDGLCVSTADLTPHQFEEINAELFAIHGESLLKFCRKLYAVLKKRSK